jgi:hypothetical protein
MADRVASDNPSVTTHDARVVRAGGTRRPCVRLPADAVATDDYVRVVCDGREYHGRFVADSEGIVLRGLYDNRRIAREDRDAPNRLVEWLDAADVEIGRMIACDEIESGFLYGLRKPGERVVYDATESPDSSLADIARDLDG